MHAEVERPTGAPASFWPDKGWTACLPAAPTPLERKGFWECRHVKLVPHRHPPGEGWCGSEIKS